MAKQLYHSLAGGPVGDVVDMGVPFRTLSITVSVATWVRAAPYDPNNVNFTAPTAPVATPDPAAGADAAAGWVKMGVNGLLSLPADPYGRSYRYIETWELSAGDMNIEGSY